MNIGNNDVMRQIQNSMNNREYLKKKMNIF